MERKLRIGVLGAAGIARLAVVPAIIASRNATVTAIASRNPAGAAWVWEAGIEVTEGYEALLHRSDVDAVYIPLPNHEHARWTMRAADVGKAVLCEKPLARDAAEAAQIVAHCAHRNVPLLEGFMYRFHPQHARVRDIIATGCIGEPTKGGGALLDMGSYTVHIARSVLGAEPHAVLARWTIDPVFGVDTDTAAILEFPGDRTACVSCSFRGNGQGIYRVVGRQGVIDVPRGIIPGLGSREGETVIAVTDADGRRSEERIPAVDQYRLMVEAFADAVLGGRPLPVVPDDAVRTLHVLDAIAASARSGARAAV
jgi:predicted dehydrogenase